MSGSKFQKAEKILLKNVTIIDDGYNEQKQWDIFIIDGKINAINPTSEKTDFNGAVLDLSGKLALPGLLDMHVHFREPGREDEETLKSGAHSAMAGGFTAACTMPNTNPATDNREVIEFILDEMKNHLFSIYPIAAITKDQQGEKLAEMAELVDAGAVAFSDDGKSVANSLLLRRALEYSKMFNVPIIEHCEDAHLVGSGDMHEGFVSSNLGLAGMPAIAEDVIVARNLMLAEYTGGKIHIAHISTKGAVDLVRQAKDKGIDVTAEATPHHFSLTDEAVRSFDSNFKMNPPLRSEEHVAAIIEGLKDGTIDAIVTDHAPHSIEEKDAEFSAAPFGIIGLETALGLVAKQLVKPGILSWQDIVQKMCKNPYRILGLEAPQIKAGEIANLTIIDPAGEWEVDKFNMKSRSRNTPFHGWKLPVRAFAVLNNGYFYLAEK
ncbi:MAG: dihydroorotase [Calditrichaeota bacterium]|nr:dihydroorotase [Calditrichota bacterium]